MECFVAPRRSRMRSGTSDDSGSSASDSSSLYTCMWSRGSSPSDHGCLVVRCCLCAVGFLACLFMMPSCPLVYDIVCATAQGPHPLQSCTLFDHARVVRSHLPVRPFTTSHCSHLSRRVQQCVPQLLCPRSGSGFVLLLFLPPRVALLIPCSPCMESTPLRPGGQ